MGGKIAGQHICQELGTLVGEQANTPYHHKTGLPEIQLRNPCTSGHKDCRLFRKGGKGICVRERGPLREYDAGEE